MFCELISGPVDNIAPKRLILYINLLEKSLTSLRARVFRHIQIAAPEDGRISWSNGMMCRVAMTENLKYWQKNCLLALVHPFPRQTDVCHFASLCDLALVELTRDSDTRPGKSLAIEPSLSLKLWESLQQMPLVVETALTEAACELRVSWSDSDHDLASVHGLDPKCRATLHRGTSCSQKRFDYLQQNGKHIPSAVRLDDFDG
jgi:hypothetical protein